MGFWTPNVRYKDCSKDASVKSSAKRWEHEDVRANTIMQVMQVRPALEPPT